MSNGGMSNGVALASLAVLLVSCSEVEPQRCTAIGCGFPITLELEAADWLPGEYVVAITASGSTFECRFERGADGAGGQAGSANQPSGIVQHCDLVSGDATETWEEPEMYGDWNVTIDLKRESKQLSVSVHRDGTLLLEEELIPSYHTSYPNGPNCGACRSAREALTLPAEGS